MFRKRKNKNKKCFCKSCLQCFSNRKVLTEHKEACLSINGAQTVRQEKGTIEFKSYFKQIQVPFILILSVTQRVLYVLKVLIQKNTKITFLVAFYKLVCVNDKFNKPSSVFRGENAAYEFSKAILKEYRYCKKVMKKHFNKNLIMT